MEKIELTEKRALDMIGEGDIKDMLLLDVNTFNLTWERLGKKRMDAKRAKVERMIGQSAVGILVEVPDDVFRLLEERLRHLHTEARQAGEQKKQERVKRQREALPRIINRANGGND